MDIIYANKYCNLTNITNEYHLIEQIRAYSATDNYKSLIEFELHIGGLFIYSGYSIDTIPMFIMTDNIEISCKSMNTGFVKYVVSYRNIADDVYNTGNIKKISFDYGTINIDDNYSFTPIVNKSAIHINDYLQTYPQNMLQDAEDVSLFI